MIEDTALLEFYKVGSAMAQAEFEKQAFLGGMLTGAKFLLGMGHLGRAGGLASRISAHHVGMPLGFGAMGALTAEDGKRMEGFGAGVLGGLAFNAGMPLGSMIGKKLLSPFGTGAKSLARMGFGPDSARLIQASRGANKQLASVQRRMSAGNYSPTDALNVLKSNMSNYGVNVKNLSPELRRQYADLLKMRGTLAPGQYGSYHSQLTNFANQMATAGVSMGSSTAQGLYSGARKAKWLGSAIGGMGMGMGASHLVEDAVKSPPSSIYSPNFNKSK